MEGGILKVKNERELSLKRVSKRTIFTLVFEKNEIQLSKYLNDHTTIVIHNKDREEAIADQLFADEKSPIHRIHR